jgi:hypothetical protein
MPGSAAWARRLSGNKKSRPLLAMHWPALYNISPHLELMRAGLIITIGDLLGDR